METEHLHIRKTAVWKEATSVVDFSRLSEERFRELTWDTYQLKISKCYIQEHFDRNNDIFFYQEDSRLLKVKLQEGTRHQSPMFFGYPTMR